MADYKVYIIPILSDNYCFIIQDLVNNITICVDPGSSDEVIEFLDKNNLKLDYIFNTHHHYDHITGNEALVQRYNCEIYAPEKDKYRIPNITHLLKENDIVNIGIFNFKILSTPGNTFNHISYHEPEHKLLFCGDTIFSSGCARIIEGTYELLFDTINKLAALDEDTKLYCAHEYTIKNIEFALQYEPSNQDLQDKLKLSKLLRDLNRPTIPTTIAYELKTNPFCRLHKKEIRQSLGFNSDHLSFKVFKKMRLLKDNF
ncbi:MAG: hydroxyacylglutathione hydrolase [Rickettsiales bacterium]|jgi:hydroxyacylglutathione hydrolase|nr:hydroxyacylglutathione hydrolase [Rickettsiales bacterium]